MSATEKIQIVIDATGEGAKRALHSVGDAFTTGLGHKAKLAGAMVGASMVAAGAALAAFTIKAVADTTEYAESIDKAAKTTGIAAEELQKLKYAADQEHTSFEALNGGLKFLAKNMEAGKDAFAEIGISTTDASGQLRNTGDVLLELSDYFKNSTNDVEKQALALKLFGKSGSDLIPFLEQGSAEIARLGEEAEGLGIVLSGDAISAFEAYGDQVDKMKKSFEGVKMSVATAVLPAFSDVSAGITDMFVSLQESGSLDAIFGTVGGVIADLLPTLQTVFDLVGSVLDALAPMLSDVLGRLGEIFSQLVGYIMDSGMIEALAEVSSQLTDYILRALENMLPSIENIVEISATWAELMAPVVDVILAIANAVMGILGEAMNFVTGLIDGFLDKLSGKNPFEEALEKSEKAVDRLAGSWDSLTIAERKAELSALSFGISQAEAAGDTAAVEYLTEKYDELSGMLNSNAGDVDSWQASFSDALERAATMTDTDLAQMLTTFETLGGSMVKEGRDIPAKILKAFQSDLPQSNEILRATLAGAITEISTTVGLTTAQAGLMATALTGILDKYGGDLTQMTDADYQAIADLSGTSVEQVKETINTLAGTATTTMDNLSIHAQTTHDRIVAAFSEPVYQYIESIFHGPGEPDSEHTGGLIRHAGGEIPVAHAGLLVGRMKSDERLILAQTEEYMMQRSAVRKYGTGFMADVNAGRYQPGGGGKSFNINGPIYLTLENVTDAASLLSAISEGLGQEVKIYEAVHGR